MARGSASVNITVAYHWSTAVDIGGPSKSNVDTVLQRVRSSAGRVSLHDEAYHDLFTGVHRYFALSAARLPREQ
jgi:hypothetical protein